MVFLVFLLEFWFWGNSSGLIGNFSYTHGEEFSSMHDIVLFLVDGVTWSSLSWHWISIAGVVIVEVPTTSNSSLNSCRRLYFRLIFFSKVLSHASSSTNYTTLFIMIFFRYSIVELIYHGFIVLINKYALLLLVDQLHY